MNSEGLEKRLAALREHRARIDAEMEQLEAQLDAQERAGQKGAEVLEVEPARGGGSYVLQKVRCGQAHLPLRQGRRGAARAVLVSLLEEGREDEEQVCGEGEADPDRVAPSTNFAGFKNK